MSSLSSSSSLTDIFPIKTKRKRRRSMIVLNSKKDIASLSPSSSSSACSSFSLNHNKHGKLISFTKRKQRHFKRKIQSQLNKKKYSQRRQALIQIRDQITNFEIPAAWTCMKSSKINSSSTHTNFC